jgi:hypothetical protein
MDPSGPIMLTLTSFLLGLVWAHVCYWHTRGPG